MMVSTSANQIGFKTALTSPRQE